MTLPNRYHLWAALECHAFSKAEAVLKFSAEEDGMWVQWQDYARLKAEVERLRKAGDALYESKIGYYGEQILEDMKHHSGELCRNWLAAKEGKPS